MIYATLNPHPLPPDTGRKDSSGVKRVSELALALTGCNAPKSRSCPSPWQHSRSDPVFRGVYKLVPRTGEWDTWPCSLHLPLVVYYVGQAGELEVPPH